MNSVELVGRLTQDPILRHTNGENKSVVSFTLAVPKEFSKKEADFFPIVVWGAKAESVAKFKKKGDRISVKGRLSNRNYDKDGVRYYVTEIKATHIQFLDNAKRNSSENSVDNENLSEGYNNYDSNSYDSNEVANNKETVTNDDPFAAFNKDSENCFAGGNGFSNFGW